MAGAQVQRIVQQDLSGGMFPSLAPELIPSNGAFDITNGLLDEQNVVYRRGGTTYACSTPAGVPQMLWSGVLKHGGLQTILSTPAQTFRVTNRAGNPTHLESLGFPGATGRVPFRAQVFRGELVFPGGVTFDGEKHSVIEGEAAPLVQFYATAANRLLAGEGTKVQFSNVPQLHENKLAWAATDYHELPSGVRILGMEGWRTSCVVFTTAGIWVIGGLNHELTDAEGNVQQTLDRYSTQAVLWGEAGLAGWAGGLVVPCRDDVWLMELGVSSEKATPFIPITGPIQNVYLAHVAAGHTPGAAAVHRSHYFLPILSGNNVVDVLVCQLNGRDSRGRPSYPWTHLAGYGAQVAAYAASEQQENPFLGATAGAGRVLNCGSYFEPGAAVAGDADGSSHPFSVTYGDTPTGNLRANLVTKGRLRYLMQAPASSGLTMSFGVSRSGGAEWGEFDWGEADWTAITGPFTALAGKAPPDPSATSPYAWRVGKKVRYARVKVDLVGPANAVSLRSLEVFVRPDGKLF